MRRNVLPASRASATHATGWRLRAPVAALAASTVLVLASGCEREQSNEPTTPAAEEWVLGDPSTYEVPQEPGGTIPEAISGGTFRFPEGGGGTISVTPVLEGPRASAEDGAFRVDYAGPSTVEFLMSDDPQATELLLSWESNDAIVLEGEEPDGCSWLPLQDAASGADLAFALPVSTSGKREARRWAGVPVFKPLRVVKGTPRDTLFVRFEQNIRDASTNLLNAIPPARRADVIARANGPLSPKLYVDMNNPGSWFPSKPKYVPFWDHVILTPRCALVIPNDAAPSIPHEVGHYLHHLLLDSGYGVFATRPLSSSHAIGSPGCRQNLIEEPAYLAEYYLKGSVGGRNPEGGGFAGSGPSGPNDPATVDFTDIEGFGMAVFASLIRDDPTILNYEGKRVAVPVVGGQRDSLFQACYEIIALGTNDIPTLLDRVRAVLAAVGKEAKLPAMLQPLGLTYRARARIVDGAGDPIEGVTARAVSKVGTTEYLLPVCDAPTGEDGACTFRTIFPGSCTLRIYDGGDSTDVGTGVSVPWGTPTTQWIDLGDVAFVPDRLLEALHRRTNVSIGFGGMMDFENGDSQYTLEEYFTGSNVQSGGAPIAWEGAAFSYSASGSYEDLCEGTISWSISISGAADLDERTMDGSLQYEAKNARESHVDSWSLQITGLPLSASSVPPYTVLRFSASGPGAAAYIGGVEAYISHLCSGYQPGNYTGTDWGNEVRPWVSIDFGEPDGGTNR